MRPVQTFGIRWLTVLACALVLLGCAQQARYRPSGPPPVAALDARSIDAEVARIRAGEHLPMPAPQSVASDPGGTIAELKVVNESPHRLEVLYSGSTSQRLVLDAGGAGAVRLQPGSYAVAARATDATVRVLPFAGLQQINAGLYNSRWFIQTRGGAASPPAAPRGKGLALNPTVRSVSDWVGRNHSHPLTRQRYAEGYEGIEQFISQLAASERALLVIGNGATASGSRCALLMVHAGEVFPFEHPATSDVKAPCRSENLEISFGGPTTKVTRASRIGTIQSFTVPQANWVDPRQQLRAEFRLVLDQAPTHPLALRLTVMKGRSTTVYLSPPLKLKLGENRISHNFPALERNLVPGASIPSISATRDVEPGPLIVVADLVAPDTARMHQLLGNSAAVLLNIGS